MRLVHVEDPSGDAVCSGLAETGWNTVAQGLKLVCVGSSSGGVVCTRTVTGGATEKLLGEGPELLGTPPLLKTPLTFGASFGAVVSMDPPFLEHAQTAGVHQGHRSKRMITCLITLAPLEFNAQLVITGEAIRDEIRILLLRDLTRIILDVIVGTARLVPPGLCTVEPSRIKVTIMPGLNVRPVCKRSLIILTSV